MAFDVAADSEAAAGVFSLEEVVDSGGCEVGGGGGRARFAAEDLPFLDGAGLLGGG